ncbi:hypothetical protein LY474_39490 [Myxococcus stipitatus]|uniref:hypothetical protein n=1 Tax=Myxococcus stipitatus TaxID=83455 RepID=UPI001F1E62D4|nr:hypothetical protein [Myxococcus stipitatus]MCE9673897.1 hypothetical protein [Myxococcus stipitatus]
MGGRKWVGAAGLGGLVAMLAAFAPGAASAEPDENRGAWFEHKKKHDKHEKHRERHEATGGSGEAGGGPKVGGHLALVVPLLNVTDEDTTVIFGDFIQAGIAPGVTLTFGKWCIDFEFIAFSKWRFSDDGTPASASTSLVVDPGIIYDLGAVSAGLRVAMAVGADQPFNFGLVPIVLKKFDLNDDLKWLVELDLPVFVTGRPGDGGFSFAPQVQVGIAF